jgi:hypothetical protein
MPGHDQDKTEAVPSVRRRSHRRRKHDAPPADSAVPGTKEKRRLRWEVKDTLLTIVALVELWFLPLAIKKISTLAILHAIKVAAAPFGLTLLSTLGGFIVTTIIFVALCYSIRKHHYAVTLFIMGAVLAFILVSHPAAVWLARLNDEQIKAKNSSQPAPARPRR